jgi:hypothetical protein
LKNERQEVKKEEPPSPPLPPLRGLLYIRHPKKEKLVLPQ